MNKKEKNKRVDYLCAAGMLETMCFEVSETKLYWYTMSNNRLVYAVDCLEGGALHTLLKRVFT